MTAQSLALPAATLESGTGSHEPLSLSPQPGGPGSMPGACACAQEPGGLEEGDGSLTRPCGACCCVCACLCLMHAHTPSWKRKE